jgi:hypothetical protein
VPVVAATHKRSPYCHGRSLSAIAVPSVAAIGSPRASSCSVSETRRRCRSEPRLRQIDVLSDLDGSCRALTRAARYGPTARAARGPRDRCVETFRHGRDRRRRLRSPHRRENEADVSNAEQKGGAGSNRPNNRRVPQLLVSVRLIGKGFAGARNQHYLQLWRPAA